jgi:hypothetical protein
MLFNSRTICTDDLKTTESTSTLQTQFSGQAMNNTLHILNGDSTRQIIEQTTISGDLCVWRDVLSDGPVVPDVGSDAFWDTRAAYMSDTFGIPTEEFRQNAQAEFEKIASFGHYKEVVLWFEYDLFCQINLLAILHWFNQQELGDIKVSLICVGREEGYEKLVGLGEIAPERFPALFERRRIMGTYDFNFASDAWLAWCSEDPTDLESFTLLPSNEFPYLADALKSHLTRFPSPATGLTAIESKIVGLIQSGVDEEREIVGKLLRWQQYFGFGDLQYFHILKRMKPLFLPGDKIMFKPEIAAQIKAGQPVTGISRDYNLGGAKASAEISI